MSLHKQPKLERTETVPLTESSHEKKQKASALGVSHISISVFQVIADGLLITIEFISKNAILCQLAYYNQENDTKK